MSSHKSGFVNIIGNPNVGKSTLMNAMVGEKLSIVTAKAQTTRHRIMGIVNGEDYQIVYSDTPGILKPNYRLQQNMMSFVDAAIGDADIILYVTDTVETADKNADYVAKLQRLDCPVIVVINKIDLSDQPKVVELMDYWHGQLPKADIIPASARERFNLESIFDKIVEKLPVSPPWYDKDTFTDRNLRFFAQEIIREKILLNYSQEIPYCCEVNVESFKEGSERYEISAVIYVMRDSQKGIIIGKKGAALKKVGTEARIDMEDFFQKKVFLSLYVKVDPDWRESRRQAYDPIHQEGRRGHEDRRFRANGKEGVDRIEEATEKGDRSVGQATGQVPPHEVKKACSRQITGYQLDITLDIGKTVRIQKFILLIIRRLSAALLILCSGRGRPRGEAGMKVEWKQGWKR